MKMSLAKNETTLNLKSASFVVIMLLHKGLTHKHQQKKPRLHFDKSFALTAHKLAILQQPLLKKLKESKETSWWDVVSNSSDYIQDSVSEKVYITIPN